MEALLGSVASGILSAASGGALGIIGSVVTKIASYFETKQQIELQKLKYDHELALHRMNLEARGKEMEHEMAIADLGAITQLRVGSYEHDASYGQVAQACAGLLRFVRPLLTFILMYLTYLVWKEAPDGVEPDLANQIIFLANMAVGWWFGDRGGAALMSARRGR